MKVKALFVNANGLISAENIPSDRRAIEFPDGAHPFMAQGVYHDIDRKGPPLIIYWHGIKPPEGVVLSAAEDQALVMEIVHVIQHKFKYPISKRWIRLFWKGLFMFLKVFGIGWLIGMAVILTVIFL